MELSRHENNYAHAHKVFVDKEQARTLKHPCRPSLQDYRGVYAHKSLEEQPHPVPPHFECQGEKIQSQSLRENAEQTGFSDATGMTTHKMHIVFISGPNSWRSCIQRQLRLTSAPRECGKIQHSVTQVQI